MLVITKSQLKKYFLFPKEESESEVFLAPRFREVDSFLTFTSEPEDFSESLRSVILTSESESKIFLLVRFFFTFTIVSSSSFELDLK